MQIKTVKLGGIEYVIMPKSEFVQLQAGGAALPGLVDAIDYGRRSLAATLRQAREAAGLTQADLAGKLGRSQTMVSGAEGGRVRVSARYVAAVLEACGLPPDWAPRRAPKRSTTKGKDAAE